MRLNKDKIYHNQPYWPKVDVNYSYSANCFLSTEGLVLVREEIKSCLSMIPISIYSFLKSSHEPDFPSSPYRHGTHLSLTCLNFLATCNLLTG